MSFCLKIGRRTVEMLSRQHYKKSFENKLGKPEVDVGPLQHLRWSSF